MYEKASKERGYRHWHVKVAQGQSQVHQTKHPPSGGLSMSEGYSLTIRPATVTLDIWRIMRVPYTELVRE